LAKFNAVINANPGTGMCYHCTIDAQFSRPDCPLCLTSGQPARLTEELINADLICFPVVHCFMHLKEAGWLNLCYLF